MLINRGRNLRLFQRVPLRVVLIAPFVAQIFAAVGLVGYFSFKNGQQAVNTLAYQLQQEVGTRVEQNLDSYMALPHQINQLNLDAIEQGRLDPRDLESAGRYFWKQSQVFPQFSYIAYTLKDKTMAGAGRWVPGQGVVITHHPGKGNTSKGLKDYTYSTDAQGNRLKRVYEAEFDPTEAAVYTETAKARKPVWSQIHILQEFGNYVLTSAGLPIYDQNRQVIGVLNIDLQLSDISKFLQQIRLSPSSQVFIIERSGQIVATSDHNPILQKTNQKIQRLNITQHSSPIYRHVAQIIQTKLGNFNSIHRIHNLEFQFNGQRQFAHIRPWKDQHGIDWLVVVTVPESDFMTQVNANMRTTLLLCGGALGGAILLGILTSRWITNPILRLKQASQAIAEGQLEHQVPAGNIEELNAVGQSFNYMAQQLQESFQELENRVEARTEELSQALANLRLAQAQLVQTEKMSGLGQVVAGVAHEINNPVSFIRGNLTHVYAYMQDLLELVQLYQLEHPNPSAELNSKLDEINLDFLIEDLAKVLKSMQVGSDRIREIVLSLRNFSRLDEAECKPVDLHSGIDSTLVILRHRLDATTHRSEISIIKEYGDLPLVECYPGQLNQVIMNLLSNAIDALEEAYKKQQLESTQAKANTIWIHTETIAQDWIKITIADNGIGIPQAARARIFDPFFTTKPVGQGTGLGLSISYQIITEKHNGKLWCDSIPGEGAKFCIEIPVQQTEMR